MGRLAFERHDRVRDALPYSGASITTPLFGSIQTS